LVHFYYQKGYRAVLQLKGYGLQKSFALQKQRLVLFFLILEDVGSELTDGGVKQADHSVLIEFLFFIRRNLAMVFLSRIIIFAGIADTNFV